MSSTNKTSPKLYCERYKNHFQAFDSFDKNTFRTVKKVIVSKKICSPRGDKSYSTGIISNRKDIQGPLLRKIAKSDVLYQNMPCDNIQIDCYNQCGDVASINKHTSKCVPRSNQNTVSSNSLDKIVPRPNRSNTNKPSSRNSTGNKPLHQYYRNEKYHPSTDSIYATDNTKKASKCSLNTIIEHSEKASNSKPTIYEIHPENYDEELGFIDPNNDDTVQNLKRFRKNNYFECHSVKSRIQSKISVNSLNNHKCVYRFYLNDRLFPVPLNTDHEENIRCIVCHLPMKSNDSNSPINGTVQAKVRLNGEIQDMLLMLPVKNSLIVKERRKVLPVKRDYDSLYFGIIKLDLNGDSRFKRNLPSNSFALRYEKGYEKTNISNKYEYECVTKDDIIVL